MQFDRGFTCLYITNSRIDVLLWPLNVLTYQYAVENNLIQPTENYVMWKLTHGQSLINYVSKNIPRQSRNALLHGRDFSTVFHPTNKIPHDDVIKWKHFLRYWPFVRGIHRSPVNSQHKGQWRRALMFSLICARINSWVNNREARDLRRHRAHYDVIVTGSKLKGYLVITRWPYYEGTSLHYT